MKAKIKILSRKIIDKIFEWGILIKSFFGVFEFLAGIALLISGRVATDNFIIALAQQEVSEDPGDFIANYFIKAAKSFSAGSDIFAIVYLIFHGLINILLALALFKNKIWAYPWAVGGFTLFAGYQVFRYFHTYSLWLLVLTLFDIFIISFILLEYRNHKRPK